MDFIYSVAVEHTATTPAVQVQASLHAVRKMILVLKDAKFLDSRTDVMNRRFVTYNHPLETLAITELQIKQGLCGRFHAQVCLPGS